MLRSDSPDAPRASPNTPRAAEHLYTSTVDAADPAVRELDGDVELETGRVAAGARRTCCASRGPSARGELLEALLEQARHDGVSVARRPHHGLRQHDRDSRGAARSPASARSNTACARSCAGTRWRWSCRPTRESSELGGHIASYQSAATLYEVGFNHFWRAPARRATAATSSTSRGTPPPASTRAPSWKAASDEERVRGFRQEVGGHGLSSYPHPWLMPDFWQFPTVSMGLGPLMAIYQARFMKYLARPRARRRPTGARCGRSWATARWTSPSRWARSRSPGASTSTT